MKIGIVSDLHIDYINFSHISALKVAALKKLIPEFDVFLMCGDNTEPRISNYNRNEFYRMLRQVSDIPIATVLGNHDLFGKEFPTEVSIEDIKNRQKGFENVFKDNNIINLDYQNLVIGDITVFGTYAHYDGTLSNSISEIDFKTAKYLNDALKDRANVPGRKLLISHTVPTIDMIGREQDDLQKKRFNFFAGSSQLEKTIKQISPDWHFCGHSHAYAQSKIGRTPSFNVGSELQNLFYFILDFETGLVERKEFDLDYEF